MAPSTVEVAKRKLGPVLVGTFLAYLWSGIALVQLFTYFRKYRRDWIGLKLLVLVSAALVFTSVILDSIICYNFAVLNFGNTKILFTGDPLIGINFTIMLLPCAFIQCFFGWRVMRLTGRVWVLVLVGIGVAGQLALRIAINIINVGFGGANAINPYLYTWWAVATSVDVLISANLVSWFRGRRTGFQDTDDLLNRLTRLAIRTCGLVTTWTIATLIARLVLTDNTPLLFAMSLPCFYLITILSSLNSRYYSQQSGHLHWSDETPKFSSSVNHRASTRAMPAEIHVTRTTEAEAYEIEERSPSKSRMTRTTGTTRVVDMLDDQSIQDSDRKVDLEIGPNEHDCSIGATSDYVMEHHGQSR